VAEIILHLAIILMYNSIMNQSLSFNTHKQNMTLQTPIRIDALVAFAWSII
jgi:hypothetical protein